ncbi:MAG: YbhB/YbcL family Raf kinase inhibitor-like protein [Thermodesulfobacteriota bacterium]
MPRTLLFCLTCVLLISSTIISSYGDPAMKLSSTAFTDGGKIPVPYVMPGAGGQNTSVPLAWAVAPPGAQSFALSMVDPHPVARNWVHWLVINIPADVRSLAAGASGKKMPPGAVELHNSFGAPGYGGPQPPPGTGDHPYVVTIYALNAPKLDLGPKTTLAAFQQALEGKVLASVSLTGYFGR